MVDDRLRLMFTCCHPALAVESRLPLTLRALGGLEVRELARAFLTTEAAMYQRLARAKRKIVAAGIPYRVPPDDQLLGRLAGVLRVVYLIYSEGHSATEGDDLVRAGLCDEALRLARLLAELMPDDPETLGLLALLLLTDARRAARTDDAGEAIGLDEQDRQRWDRDLIAEGVDVLERALRRARPGPYQVQAAIAAVHADAPDADATDWAQIAALYATLAQLDRSPVVTVNRAVAVARADGPHAGLRLLAPLDGDERLARYQPLHAARAELLQEAGDLEAARAAYRHALELTDNARERSALRRRAGPLAPGDARRRRACDAPPAAHSPRAWLTAAASVMHASVMPPSAWLEMSMTTRFHELDQSGWWPSFSASRATMAMNPKASTKLWNSSSRWSVPLAMPHPGMSANRSSVSSWVRRVMPPFLPRAGRGDAETWVVRRRIGSGRFTSASRGRGR